MDKISYEIPFDESFLDSGLIIDVHCPRQEDVEELFRILKGHGVIWVSGNELNHTNWNEYRKDTCYEIENGYLSYENVGFMLTRSKAQIKCTFYGSCQSPEFTPASEEEVSDLLFGRE